MKKSLSTLLAVAAAIALPANAQVTESIVVTEVLPIESTKRVTTTTTDGVISEIVPKQTQTVTEFVPAAPVRTVTEVVPAALPATVTGRTATVHRLDPAVARRQLSITPQSVTITPAQRTALDRTVTIESRAVPARRVYNIERNVVIVEDQGQSRELPYVTVPVLFVVDTAELLDAESREALEQTAAVINEVTSADPNAVFDVEGHTSTEGGAEHNMRLSADRSKRIYDELTKRYGVPASALTAHGYGLNFAMYPDGTEGERQEDRRVLVVRTR